MRMHPNELRPDTCGCYIQLHRDLDVPNSPQEMKHFLEKCPAHAAMSDVEAWDDIWLNADSEQKRKNELYKALTVDDPLGLGADLVELRQGPKRAFSEFFQRDLVVFDQNGAAVLDDRYELIGGPECYTFVLDQNRCVCICFDGCWLDVATKARLQMWADSQYGLGVVRIMNANEEA